MKTPPVSSLFALQRRFRQSPAVQELARDFRALVRRACRANLAFGKYALTLLLVSYLSTPQLFAASVTWDITTGDGATIEDGGGTWSLVLGNFNNAGVDGSWSNGDDVIFGGGTLGAFGTVTLGSAITVGNITFNTPNGGGAYTIDTSTFGLTMNTGITATEDATIQSGVGGSVILGANNIWAVSSSGKTLTVNSVVDDGASSFSLNKQGAGVLELAGANTFDGGVTISAGTLRATHNTALGTGAASVTAGAALELSGNITVGNAITLNGTGITANGALRGFASATEASGAITLASDSRINSDNNGTLTLSGGITGGFNLTFGGTANVLVNSIIGTGAGNLTKDGVGVLILSGANTYTGTTLVSDGVLRLDSATALPGGIDTAVGVGESALTLGGGVLGLRAGDFTRALGTGAGQVQFTASSGFAAYSGARNVNLNGNGTPDLMTWNSTASFLAAGQSLILGAASADNTVTFQNPIDLNGAVRTIQVDDGSAPTDAVLSGALGGTGGLTKAGGGTLDLTAINTFSGGLSVDAGTLVLSAANTFSGGVTVNGGTLRLNNATAIAAGNALVMNGGTLSLNGNNQTVSGLTGAAGTVENGLTGLATLTVNKAAGTDTFSGVLANGAAGSLAITKTGAGTLALTGNNTFTGNITISGGALQIIGPGGVLETAALGAAGPRDIILQNNAAFNLITGSLNPGVNTKRFVIGSGGGTVDIPTTLTLQLDDVGLLGQLTGSGDLTTANAGTLFITGQSGFTGKLILGGTTILSAIDATAFGSELQMGAGTTLTLRGNIGAGSAQPLKFNGDSTIGGAFNLLAPSVELGSGTPRQLTINATEVIFSGPISVGVGLTKAGTGRLTLSGANTYTGPTTVNAGVLLLNNANALPGGIGAGGTGNLTLAASAANPVIGLGNGNFTRPLGIGPTGVQFTGAAGGAGFAAFGADRTVNLGGASGVVIWNTTPNFLLSGAALILGNALADGRVDFQNPIDLNSAPRTVQVDNGGAVVDATLSGILSGVGGALTKTGAGTLDLTGNNSYPGATAISAGVLRASHANALGTTGGGVTVSASSALEINGVSIGAEALSLAGFGPSGAAANNQMGGALRNLTGVNTYAGLVTLTAASRINSDAGTLTLNNVGTITGAGFGLTVGGAGNVTINSIIGTTTGGLTKDGSGNLTLTGVNTYTGNTVVNRGTLTLDYTAATGRIADTGVLVLGGGTVALTGSGAHNEVVASTSVNAGGSSITRAVAGPVLRLNAITRAAGGTVDFGAVSIADTDTANNIAGVDGILGGWATVAGANWAVSAAAAGDTAITGAPTYVLTSVALNVPASYAAKNIDVNSAQTPTAAITPNSIRFNTSTARTLTLTGVNTITTGGILVGTGATSGTASVITGGTLVGSAGATGDLVVNMFGVSPLTISSIIANNGAGPTGLTRSGTGAGVLTLSGVNTYTGSTFINGGVVSIAADSGLGTAPGSATPGSLTLNGGTLTITGAITLNANRGILLNAGGGTINLSADVTYAGIIAGPGALTKAGGNTLTLNTATSTFTGGVVVTGGQLSFSADARLGAVPAVPTPANITLGAGVTLSQTATGTISANRGILLNGSATINEASGDAFPYGGIITSSGVFGITKAGTGTVTLSGLSTYTGPTAISGTGALTINTIRNVGAGNASALGAPTTTTDGTIAIGSGGTGGSLTYNGTGDTTDRVINLAGTTGGATLDQSGIGLLRFTSDLTTTGVGAKTLTLQGSTTGTGELAGAIVDSSSGATALTKGGSGLWTLSGNTAYTGVTDVNAGTLVVSGAAGDIAQSSQITVRNTGVLRLNALTDSAVVDRIGNTQTVYVNSGGVLNLNGTTFAGTTTEDVGALFIGLTDLQPSLNQTVTLTAGSGQDLLLQADSLGRSAGTTVLFRGTGLGTAAGANTSRIKFDTTPNLLGGGGASGTSTISVLPFASVDTTAAGLGGNSLATYDSTLGVRPLNLINEVSTSLAGAANRNINLTANAATAGDQTIGSLRIAGGNLTITATDTLANTSGAILFTTGNSINGPGTNAFGLAEGFIHGLGVAAGTPGILPQMNAVISGSGGLTLNPGAGNTLTLGGNNTFTGPVNLNSGTVQLGSGNAFGQATAAVPNPLRINQGSLDLNGQNVTIGALYGASGAGIINNSSANPATLTIDTSGGLYTGVNSTYTPVISQFGGGAVSIVKNGANQQTLAGANTITGSVTVNGGTLVLSGVNATVPTVTVNAGTLNLTSTMAGLTSLTVGSGASFLETLGTAAAVTDRINNAAAVTLAGGTFSFNMPGGAFNYSETLASLALGSGGSTLSANRAASGQTSRLTFTSTLSAPSFGAGATLNFTGTSLGALADVSRNQIIFTAVPGTPNGILGGYATLNGLDWATYLADADTTTGGNQPSVSPLTAYTANPAESGYLTTLNVRSTTGGTVTFTGNRVVNSLNFAPTAATTLNLGGFVLNAESGGILASGAFDSTIQNGTLRAGTGAGGDLFFHTYSPAGNLLTVSSVIDDDGIGNVVNVVKAGTGTLLLSGANSFTGSLTLNGGTLRLGHATAIGNTTANVRLNSGQLTSGDSTARTIANPVIIGGDITLGDASGATGALTFSGTVDISGMVRTITVSNASDSISGAISGTGGFVKAGAGQLNLNGAANNTYTGLTVVNQGTLQIDNTGLTADRNPLGTGQLRFGGGTVQIGGGGAGGPYADIVSSATVNSGHSRITTTGSPTYVLRLNTLSASTGGTLDFGAGSIAQVDNANVNGILGAYATVGGADWAMNSAGADGLVTAYAAYTSGGGTDPLGWNAADNFTFAANPQSITNNASANSLRFTAGSSVSLSAGKILTLTSGGILNTGSGLSAISGGIIRGGGPQNELVIQQYNTTQPLIISSVIANNASGSPTALVKSGPGELILANDANTFTGVKYLNGGTLTINPTGGEGSILGTARPLGAIPASGIDIIFNGGTLALGPLTVAGQATALPLSGNRQIRLDANGGTLVSPSISGAPRVFQMDSVVAGAGSLTFSGNGGFLPNAANTYSGGTIINANAIVMPNTATSFGTGPITLNNGAILSAWNTFALTLANPIQILGNVNLGYGGVTGGSTSTGWNTFNGAVDLGGATRQITVDTTRTNTIGGIISNGGITKSGGGLLIFSNANTFTGALTINQGTNLVDTTAGTANVNPNVMLAVGGGAFQLRGFNATARSLTLNGLTVNSGASAVQVNNTNGTSTTLDLRGPLGTAGITRNAGGVVDFRGVFAGFGTASTLVKTFQANDATGILGAWATVNTNQDWAMKDGSDNIVAYTAYTDYTRLASGTKILANDTTKNNRIIEGTGGAASITLAAATTDMNTLLQSASGGTGAATIDPGATDILRLGAVGGILVAQGAGALTIGTTVADGFLTAGGAVADNPGELILNNGSTSLLTINSLIQDNGLGAVRLTTAGRGTTLLTAANTYSGDTVIGHSLGLTAGTLQLGASERIPNGAGKGDVTVNGTLDLNNFSETINGLNGYGTINNVAAATAARTLTVGGNNASGSFSGVIAAGTTSGSFVTGLTKIGTGTQILSGANTYTGPTLIQNGALRVDGGFDRLPVGTTVTLGSGGATGKLIVARDQTVGDIDTTGLGGSIVGVAGTVPTFTVNLATADRTFGGLLGGGLSGENNLGLAKSGSFNLTLTAANTATGPVTVNAGTLTLSGLNGSVAASGVTVLTGGTLSLDNGAGVINGNRIPNSAPITLLGGGTTTLNFLHDGITPGNYTETLGPLTILGSSGTVIIFAQQAETGTMGSTSTLTFSSLSLASGVTLQFNGTGLGDSGENRIFITGQADGVIPGAKVNSDDAQYSSTLGVYPLAIYNTDYTPFSHPTAGAPGPNFAQTPLSWVSTDKANPAGGVRFTAAANVTLVALKLDNDGSVNTPGYNAIDLNGGSLTLTGSSIASLGVASQSIINGTLTAGTGSATTLSISTVGANQLTINAVIANNGAGVVGLTKTDAGTLVLGGVNTYTGLTLITGGTVSISADSGLGAAPGAPVANKLTLNGGTLLLTGGASIVANRGITLGASHGTIQVDAGSSTINSIIAGASRNLTKTGAGSLTLNRANTFSGIMTLNGGTLVATADVGALGAGTLRLTSGNLVLRDDTGRNFARNTTVNGNSTITTDRLTAGAGLTHTLGTLSIGAQTLTVAGGATTPTSGTQGVTFGAVTLTGAPTFTVNNGGAGATTLLTLPAINNGANTITVNGTGNTTITGVIGAGAGGLTKAGPGVLTLSGANTYSGQVQILGGILGMNVIDAATTGALGAVPLVATPNSVLIDGGTLRSDLAVTLNANRGIRLGSTGPNTIIANVGNLTYAGIIDESGVSSLTIGAGGGLWAVGGLSTYSGGTTLASGSASAITASTTGSPGSPTAGPFGTGTLNLNGGSLRSTSTAAQSIGNVVSLSADTTFPTVASEKTLTLAGPATLTANRILTANVGATVATEGVIFSGAIGDSGSGFSLTQGGTGRLTLSGANTFTGGVNLNTGTLILGNASALGGVGPGAGTFTIAGSTTLDSSVASLVNANNNPVIMNGDFTFTGTQSLDLGTGAASLGSTAGARTITVSANTLTLGGIVSDGTATGLTKAGAGTLALGGANVYSGPTTVSGGMLLLNNATALPGGIAAGGTSGLTLNGGVVGLGNGPFNRALGTGVDQVQFTGNGGFAASGANRVVNLGGGSGAVTWASTPSFLGLSQSLILGHVSADSTVDFQNPINLNAAVRTIQVDNGSAAVDAQISGLITGAASSGLTKTGAGTLLLSQANTYIGATRIDNGVVKLGVNNALPVATSLAIGTGSTVGGLDLDTFNQTVANLAVNANSASDNTLAIGSGKTLTVGGTFTVGFNSGANTTTRLIASGLGTLSITAGNFQLGGSTTDGFGNSALLDMSALSAFNYNVSGGTFRVGDTTDSGGAGTGNSTLILAGTSTITATTFSSDSPHSSGSQLIRLGSVANTINANTVTIGQAANRGGGTLNFNTGTGTLTIRNTAGTGRANMTVGYGSTTTGATPTSTVNLAGHSVDLLLNNLQIGGRTGASGASSTGTFTFDTGTLDATSVIVGDRPTAASTATGNVVGTLNLGGGTVIIGAGGLIVGRSANTTVANSTSGTINVSGGTVTVGATAGTSITLGSSAVASVPATGALNITGGTVTVAGNIIKGTAVGAVTSTLALNGASAILDMNGKNITGLTGITFTDGTLKNLGVVNTGLALAGSGGRVFDQGGIFLPGDIQGTITGTSVGLTKQGTGILMLSGANTYDGVTTVSGGVLTLNNANALPGGIGAAGGTSGLTFNGGVIGLANGDFNRDLGTGVAQVQFTGSGGFAAFGSDRNVNLGGAAVGVTWNSGSFVPTGSALILGSANSANTVTFVNPIDFNGLTRSIEVADGTAPSGTDAILTGVLSGTGGGGLTKTGAGTLELASVGANTYTGDTTVSAGTLRLNRTAADNSTILTDGNTATTSDIVINGGTLQILDNEQISDLGSISMSSGAFNFGTASGKTETIDKLTTSGGTFTTGANTLEVIGATVTWSGGNNTINTGGTVSDKHWKVSGGVNLVDAGGTLRVQNGGGTSGFFFEGTGSPLITLNSSAGTAGQILLKQDVTVDATLTGTAEIRSGLALANLGFVDMDGGTRTFTVNNGSAAVDLLISAKLQNGALVKAGTGTLQLSAANAYGKSTVNAGVLSIASDSNLGTVPGAAVADQLKLDGGTLQTTGTTTLVANRGITLGAANGTIETATSTTLTAAGIVAGAGSLTKTGAGSLVLSGANTYTGPTAIQNGTVSVSSLNSITTPTPAASSSLGAPTTVADGTIAMGSTTTTGTLLYTGTGETTDRVINLAGTTGGATIDQSGTGLLKFTSALTATGAGSKTLTLQGSTAGTGEISGVIVDAGGADLTSVTKSGSGTWVLSGANTYTGVTKVSGGILAVDTINNGGVAGGIGQAGTGAANLVLDGGTLKHTGSSGGTTDRNFTLTTSGGTLLAAGSVPLTFNGTGPVAFQGSGTRTLILDADPASASGFLGVDLGDNGGATSLTKNGGGTWTVQANVNNTYSGNTDINLGTLIAQNAGALGGTGQINVNSGGTLLLGGSGDRVNNSATMTLNGGTFNTAGSSETLGVLTLSGNSTIDFASGISSILTFAGSTGTWTSTLSVWNWTGTQNVAGGTDQLVFSSAVNIAGNVNQISFYSGAGTGFLGTGLLLGNEVVPVPEPATWLAIFAVLGLLGWRERRRLVVLVQRVRGQ